MAQRTMHHLLKIFIVLFIILTSCNKQDGLKEINDFKDIQWAAKNTQVFKINVKDISKPYVFNYLIRTSLAYPYYNLYLNQKLKDPSGKVVKNTTEEIILFDPKTGKPKGDGLGDIFDFKVEPAALKQVVFPVQGIYTWEISHQMRPDPLLGVMSIGAEIIKVEL